jgi:hypothetical protein
MYPKKFVQNVEYDIQSRYIFIHQGHTYSNIADFITKNKPTAGEIEAAVRDQFLQNPYLSACAKYQSENKTYTLNNFNAMLQGDAYEHVRTVELCRDRNMLYDAAYISHLEEEHKQNLLYVYMKRQIDDLRSKLNESVKSRKTPDSDSTNSSGTKKTIESTSSTNVPQIVTVAVDTQTDSIALVAPVPIVEMPPQKSTASKSVETNPMPKQTHSGTQVIISVQNSSVGTELLTTDKILQVSIHPPVNAMGSQTIEEYVPNIAASPTPTLPRDDSLQNAASISVTCVGVADIDYDDEPVCLYGDLDQDLTRSKSPYGRQQFDADNDITTTNKMMARDVDTESLRSLQSQQSIKSTKSKQYGVSLTNRTFNGNNRVAVPDEDSFPNTPRSEYNDAEIKRNQPESGNFTRDSPVDSIRSNSPTMPPPISRSIPAPVPTNSSPQISPRGQKNLSPRSVAVSSAPVSPTVSEKNPPPATIDAVEEIEQSKSGLNTPARSVTSTMLAEQEKSGLNTPTRPSTTPDATNFEKIEKSGQSTPTRPSSTPEPSSPVRETQRVNWLGKLRSRTLFTVRY